MNIFVHLYEYIGYTKRACAVLCIYHIHMEKGTYYTVLHTYIDVCELGKTQMKM